MRGAELVAGALARAGAKHLFSLSGNQIMPLYDAAPEAGLRITHVRHEGAAVHMADAWGRLTGEVGVALLTAGPGHANGAGALYSALAAESPMLLLSGHAPLGELGRGAFQEMRQSELVAPVTKASWTVRRAEDLGTDLARAMRLARSGRPGPVHLSVPADLLEARLDPASAEMPPAQAFLPGAAPLGEEAARALLGFLEAAARPLVLTGPTLAADRHRGLRQSLEAATGVPVVGMQSPRGIHDPALGAFAEVLAQADAIVLLDKAPDFGLRFALPPAVDAPCRIAAVAPGESTYAHPRIERVYGADAVSAAGALCEHAARRARPPSGWLAEVRAAIAYRPTTWGAIAAQDGPAVHPLAVGRAVQERIDRAGDAVLVVDGGEFGQWAQASLSAPERLINGPAGSIGSAIPFALAAKLARPGAAVFALLGDGTLGFHLAEFDTAVRGGLAFVAVIGNDACWNAEYQIQLRDYGAARAVGCELLPARYDLAVGALGGHGEQVETVSALGGALERARLAAKPACVNVRIGRHAAPKISREKS